MQWWNGDDNRLQHTWTHELRTSANGDAVHGSTADAEIEPERGVWWGAHD